MTSSSQSPPSPTRNPLRLADVIVGIVGSLVSLIVFASILFGIVPYVPSKTTALVLAIVTVVVWVAAEAFFIRWATRRRVSFYWPFVGIAAMFVGANLIVVIASGRA